MEVNDLTKTIIGAAIEVHRTLGPGLLESTYEACLFYELEQMGIFVERQVELPVKYKNVRVEIGYKIDLLVENQVIIEVKSVKELLPVHLAQIITYLKISNKSKGLLMNFNEAKLIDGVKRISNDR
ncbi:MAG: GxxExxY protein [Flavobacteriia bacterium]|nr:GxxExxY protein [Cryomorphaceae bacterium]